LALQFFWKKNIGAKAACKMLVKLTTGGARGRKRIRSRAAFTPSLGIPYLGV